MQIKSTHGRYFAILRRPDGTTFRVRLGTKDEKEAYHRAEIGGLKELEHAAMAGGAALDAAIKYAGVASAAMEDAAEEYLEDLRIAGRSPGTIANYRSFLMAWIRSYGLERFQVCRVSPDYVDRFVNTSDNVSWFTRCYRYTVLNLFFNAQVKKCRVLHNPCNPVGVRRHGLTQAQLLRKKTYVFTEEEYQRLLVQAEKKNAFWHLMLVFGRDSALRPVDIASLEVVNIEGDRVRLVMRKTGKEIELPITPAMKKALDWREPGRETFLFPEYRRAACDPLDKRLSREFRAIAKKAGVMQGSLRSLRKMGAMQEKANVAKELHDMIERESLRRTADKLGHSDTRTTQEHYLQP